MATANITHQANGTKNCNSIAADIKTVICKAYPLEALLTGALSLLQSELDAGAGTNSNVFAAFQIIDFAKEKATEIWMYSDDTNLVDRIKALEEVVNHA